MNREKTTLASLRNIEWRTVKTETNKLNQVLPYMSTNNVAELNGLIYAGAKLACEKIGMPQKARRKIKTRVGNSTGNTDKKSTKTDRNDITMERHWNMLEQKGKSNIRKNNNTT